MTSVAISYDEVMNRLREAEEVIEVLLNAQADAVITPAGVHLLRLHDTDRALHLAKASLERLLEERTRRLRKANRKLRREIRERQRAEAALAASERRFRALLESAPEAVIAMDSSGRIVMVNVRAERIFGYDRQELTGRSLDLLVPGLRSAEEPARSVHEALQPGTSPIAVGQELVGVRKDGAEFPVEVALSAAEANGEQLTVALVADITERKRVEENLRERQKLESIGLLAGGVAHDFNNLLTAILGNASLLEDRVPKDSRRLLDAVINGAEKASQVTRQLLAYAGKGQFHITDLDVSRLVRENADLIRVSIPKRIDIRLDLAHDIPCIHADAGQIQQVLMNLVINASDAIGDNATGAITITTGCEQASAGHSACEGRFVRITVSDTGCGMSEETKARIFDPFFTTKSFGRGLGLSAVLGILRSCAGTIHIDSMPGRGTTFKLLFPAVEREAEIETAAVDTAAHMTGARILVADDEEAVRTFAALALRRAGHTVFEAADGTQAVDLIHSGTGFDLVLLDVTMPGISGRETLARICQLCPAALVVMTSGYASEEAHRLMSSGNVAGFIQKPYTAQQLIGLVDGMLSSKDPARGSPRMADEAGCCLQPGNV